MLVTILFNLGVIALVVVLHYEALRYLSNLLMKLNLPGRLPVLLSVPGVLVAHAAEVWIFAFAYYIQLTMFDNGTLVGADGTLLDCAYFSFSTYTSLGIGDIYPVGHIRFHAGLEALVGLVMIGWTASFLYVEMERYWNNKAENGEASSTEEDK